MSVDHFDQSRIQREQFLRKAIHVMRPGDYTPYQLYRMKSIDEALPSSVPASMIHLPSFAPIVSGRHLLGLMKNPFDSSAHFSQLLPADKVKVYVVSHNAEALKQFADWPGYATVDLSALSIGKFQSNQFSESRLFLSNYIEDTIGDAEYLAIVSSRYDDKYHRGIRSTKTPLHALHYTLRYVSSPNRVLSASVASKNWVSDMTYFFPSLIGPMQEVAEYAKLPLYTGRPTVLCNNYCAHISVYKDHVDKFRDWFGFLYEKYGELFPIRWDNLDASRASGYVSERLTELYFANSDLDLVHLP